METSIVIPEFVDARVAPSGALESLSQEEIEQLLSTGQGGLYPLFRACALAVLNAGSDSDDAREIFDKFRDFEVEILRHAWGVRLDIRNAPAQAFVDGRMIRGTQELLFAVLRDVVYTANEIVNSGRFDLSKPVSITNAVFHILRNARILDHKPRPNLIVCWGGHSINRVEYEYTKRVGYQLGLRGLDVCTGCGPGAMKGPMKGATIGHAKQRITTGRYIGLTEPGIIAAEPPNPIVNQLVIMPDIEKRLESFLRLAHGLVVFPGGVGTAEEIFYLMGVLLDPANADQPLPVILTGPRQSAEYFDVIRRFLVGTLGESALERLHIVIDDEAEVARILDRGVDAVRDHRRKHSDSFNFNWLLRIDADYQRPFEATHQAMRELRLDRAQPVHALAADMRRAFSGIVSGNVKEQGIRTIERHGPFELVGDPELMRLLDELLGGFVAQQRMKLPGARYEPCYRIVRR
ncbi:MAG: nucleotide 5'-monophosphate nucleosidase PpnN [Steroidobacteraceae bacterium]|jgi:predicted Rossmann-fold nucleotide-binding protein